MITLDYDLFYDLDARHIGLLVVGDQSLPARITRSHTLRVGGW